VLGYPFAKPGQDNPALAFLISIRVCEIDRERS